MLAEANKKDSLLRCFKRIFLKATCDVRLECTNEDIRKENHVIVVVCKKDT